MVQRGSKPGPFFTLSDGSFLTRDCFVKAVREGLLSAGIQSSNYAGHSFWIGAATTAAHQGIQESTIKMVGPWQSSAYMLYIRTPRVSLCAISKALVTQQTH